MMRVVLDTNVIVSAHLRAGGLEDLVFRIALGGHLELCVSEPILDEYERVLRSAKFSLDPARIKEAMAQIRRSSIVIDSEGAFSVCSHESDNRFLECAVAADAQFLVTGNKRHFPPQWRGTRVINARELFELTPGLKR